MTLEEACDQFRRLVATHLAAKKKRIEAGQFTELDHSPFWYRMSYMFRRQAHTNPWTSMQFWVRKSVDVGER
jgi:hypothetical protein